MIGKCARCGAPATHFIEYPNVDTNTPAYLYLCKGCAREAAEIIRSYQQGRAVVCYPKQEVRE